MADQEPFRGRRENPRGEDRRGGDRRDGGAQGPRRGDSARGAGTGNDRGAGRRFSDGVERPRNADGRPERREGGAGRPAREGGFSREGGQRREGGAGRPAREGGFSREGGQRREGGAGRPAREGGFSREGGQRRDETNERGPRREFGSGRGAESTGRSNWQDRNPQGSQRSDGRGADRGGSRDSGRRWDASAGSADRAGQGGNERRSFRDSSSGGYSRGSAPRDSASSSNRDGGANRGEDRRPARNFGEDRRPPRAYGDAPRGAARREADRGGRPERSFGDQSTEQTGFERPHNASDLRSANRPDRERSPEIDEDVTGSELDKITRAEIRNLEERSALWVAKHLVMAGRLIEDDPELAFQHALAASRRGGRLAVVREAVGLTAYAAGHYGEALREFRTYRRISGSNAHLPVMADCERGLGRPDRALDLARSEDASSLDAAGKVELAIVVSGARTDLGQLDAAVAALEIPQLTKNRAFSYSPRLFRAYADALQGVGREEEAASWRRQADVAENALGVGAFADPDIIDLAGDEEDPGLDRTSARDTVESVASPAAVEDSAPIGTERMTSAEDGSANSEFPEETEPRDGE